MTWRPAGGDACQRARDFPRVPLYAEGVQAAGQAGETHDGPALVVVGLDAHLEDVLLALDVELLVNLVLDR
jgi:hypothetical protein